jgi:hypothetical protein
MVSEHLKQEARKAWFEYGEAIKKAWRFSPDARIVADGLEQVLASSTDERVQSFTKWVRAQIAEVKTTKFVGEE